MAGNIPNVSRDSFDVTKMYDQVTLQQGVPIVDSDWNEQADINQISQMLVGMYGLGDLLLPAIAGGNTAGYQLEEASAPTNNFQISGGWAMVKGILVPTVLAAVPTDHDYEDDTNRLGEGTVSSVADPNFTDSDKNWQSWHSLTNCRVKMTSGAESGNTFTITSLVGATTLALSGGTGGIGAGDTYIVKPPALTTPGGSRTDWVYLMVWFEDINENEDSNIVNPGVAVEASHRRKRRWCVRVAENASAPTTPDQLGFGVRYMTIGRFLRTASADIVTAEIDIWLASVSIETLTSSYGARFMRHLTVSGSPYSLPTDSIQDSLGVLVDDLNSLANTYVAKPVRLDFTGLSATTKFQLTGKRVYVGTEGVGSADAYFYLRSYQNPETPVIGAGGIFVNLVNIWDSTDDHILVPSGEADSDGFYYEPYVEIDSFTGNLSLLCNEREELYQIGAAPAEALALANMIPKMHAGDILNGDVAGTPSSLNFDSVNDQITSMMGFINERIPKTDPNAEPNTEFVLVWRSGNRVLDAAVEPQTISWYYKDYRYLMLIGGYIDSSDDIHPGGSSTYDVTALYMDSTTSDTFNGIYFLLKKNPSSTFALGGLDDPETSDWDVVHKFGHSEDFFPSMVQLGMDAYVKGSDYVYNDDDERMRLVYESGDASPTGKPIMSRIYAGSNVSDDVYAWFTLNAQYNPSTGQWNRDNAGTDDHSIAIALSKLGVFLCSQSDADVGAWDYAPADWRSCIKWVEASAAGELPGDFLACFTNVGEVMEWLPFRIYVENVRSSDDSRARDGLAVLQYRNKWETPPSQTVIVVDTTLAMGTPAIIPHASPMDSWGTVVGVSTSIALSSLGSGLLVGRVKVMT